MLGIGLMTKAAAGGGAGIGLGKLFALSAGSQMAGQWLANRANRESAREAMRFERNMSNTAWQRGIGDLRSAGLNPMLAYSQGPASSPSGTAAQHENIAGSMVGSALQAKRLKQELKNMDADVKLKRAAAITELSKADMYSSSARSLKAGIGEKKGRSDLFDKILSPGVKRTGDIWNSLTNPRW